jgi:hypothetical protein
VLPQELKIFGRSPGRKVNSGDTLLVFFDKGCGRFLPSIKGRERAGSGNGNKVLRGHNTDF